jgi:hypothetical protein
MPASRSVVSAIEITVALVGVAVAVSRHPAVRAGIKAAPLLVTPGMKSAAADAALSTAYKAGVLARRLVPRGLVR